MQEQNQRRLRFVLSLFVGILLTASGGTDAAVAQQEEAQQEKPLSIQQRLRAALEKQLRENASPEETVPVEAGAEGEDPNLAKIKRIGGKLISLGARGTWSPDGTRLAFGKDPFNSGINIRDMKTGKMTELVSLGKDPIWSPKKGRWIAYTREVDGVQEVCVIEASGGKPMKLATGVYPTWSADGSTVYFFSRLTQQIMSMNVEQPGAKTKAMWKVLVKNIPFNFFPVVSPDGRFVALKDANDVRIIEMKTHKTIHTWRANGWRGFLGGWSPDSKRLAFGGFGGENNGMWMLDMDGAEPRRLLAGFATAPSWTADGSRLAFDYRNRSIGYQVWVIDSKGIESVARQGVARGMKMQAVDEFDGQLALNWKPVRHDLGHVSLAKNPGTLTITTQRGSIHGNEKVDPVGQGHQAKNIFLIDNPLAENTDFTITLAVKEFHPETNYHQVGLICYDDDDNYLKWSCEYSGRAPDAKNFVLVRESDQEFEHDLIVQKPKSENFWLRVTKRGTTYQCAYSVDGKKFVNAGEKPWSNGAPQRIGFLAKNGGNPEAEEIDVCIDSFELSVP